MKFCSNCGTELTGDEKFCHGCGTRTKKQSDIIENKEEIQNTEEKNVEIKEEVVPVVEEQNTEIKEEVAPVVEEQNTEIKEEVAPIVEEQNNVINEPTTNVVNIEPMNSMLSQTTNQVPNQIPQQNNINQIPTPPQQPAENKNNVGLIILLIVLVIGIGVAGFFGGYFLLGNNNDTEEKENNNKENEEEKEENEDEDEDENEVSSYEVEVGNQLLIIPNEFEHLKQDGGVQITNGEWVGVILDLNVSYEITKENLDLYAESLENNGFEVVSTEIIKVNKNEYIEIRLKQEALELVALLTKFDDTTIGLTMADVKGGKIDKSWYKEYDNILENSK